MEYQRFASKINTEGYYIERSAVMPLSRIYRADRIFGVKKLDFIMTTYTMHAKNK